MKIGRIEFGTKVPDAWKNMLRTRDSHPALADSEIRELAVTVSRFQKAQRMADILLQQRATAENVKQLDPDAWTTVEVLAGCTSSSVTRALVVLILEDREKQMEGLMDELEAVEYVRSNFTPAEVFRP